MQMVELAYPSRPDLRVADVAQRASELLGEPLDVQGDDASQSVSLWHRAHPIRYADGKEAPPSTTLLHSDQGCAPEQYAEEIQQSWATEDPAALLAGSRHSVLVTEMMASGLPPVERLRLFHGVLQAVVEAAPPAGMVAKHGQQVVSSAAYLASCDAPPLQRAGAFNVRLFRVDGSEGEVVMDTRGLDEVGLHDIQCHFRGLDPNEVEGVLRNIGAYVVDRGPVIESGHTVPGVGPGVGPGAGPDGAAEAPSWRCQFEKAIVGPERELLDLDPGAPHAAGHRG
ncbi:MAG: DUF4261 domain-containing protein [Planctomycetota bacterium]